MQGPANAPVPPLPGVPPTKERLQFALTTHPEGGQPYARHPYTLYKDGAQIAQGITDDMGRVLIDHTPGTASYEVELASGARYTLPIHQQFADAASEPGKSQRLAAQGRRGIQNDSGRHNEYPQPDFGPDEQN